jgi:TolA-binding protein
VAARRAPRADIACVRDPHTLQGAKSEYECARAAFDAGDFTSAERLAANITLRYPYSRMAVAAEELRGDVLFATGDYAGAEQAYASWLARHPTNDHKDDVERKRDEAKVRAP